MHFVKISLLLVYALFNLSCQNKASAPSNISNESPDNAIIGGVTTTSDEYPFIVNIWLNSPQDDYVAHLCGASLIHKKWVLTAAHCVLEEATESTQRPIKPAKLKLFIGSDHISGQNGRALKVKTIVVHPAFSWPHHDVALLELTEPVSDVNPIVLNDQDLGDSESPLTATVIGWGLTDLDGKIDGEFLQKISLPLITRKTCSADPFPRKRGWIVGADTLCAQTSQNLKASCPGDSGGPLFHFVDGHYEQIGIVSWGSACSGSTRNVVSNVEGHADVSDALAWIQSIINSR